MSKKKSGLLIALGAMLGGAAAAGISYYLKLKSFNNELDQDFHEYEEEDTPSGEKEEKTEPAPERTYITINSGKEADDSETSEKEEAGDSGKPECPKSKESPEVAGKNDPAVKGELPGEKTSSVVVEDDTEEEKAE